MGTINLTIGVVLSLIAGDMLGTFTLLRKLSMEMWVSWLGSLAFYGTAVMNLSELGALIACH